MLHTHRHIQTHTNKHQTHTNKHKNTHKHPHTHRHTHTHAPPGHTHGKRSKRYSTAQQKHSLIGWVSLEWRYIQSWNKLYRLPLQLAYGLHHQFKRASDKCTSK